MRRSNWTPSIAPGTDQNVYLVVDDLGRLGRVWRESDVEATDLETVIQDMLDGQYKDPVRVIGFNRWKAGRRIFRGTLPKSCDAAATSSLPKSRYQFRTLSNGTSDMIGSN
jgi:hypothetical protein